MKSERVLVVDDEPALLRAMQVNLEARGYECLVATDGESALRAVAREHPDIVILDLGLPGIDGFDVLAGIRGWTSVPVIVLSARDAEPSKVNALDAGADDYVTKPFGMDELFARLRAALRRRDERAGAEEPAIVVTPEFVGDLGTRRVSRQGQYVHLTPREWAIVEILVRHAGRLVTQSQVLNSVWGPGFDKETHYLRVYLSHIRQKLEPEPSHPRYFVTEVGVGYRFEPSGESAGPPGSLVPSGTSEPPG